MDTVQRQAKEEEEEEEEEEEKSEVDYGTAQSLGDDSGAEDDMVMSNDAQVEDLQKGP